MARLIIDNVPSSAVARFERIAKGCGATIAIEGQATETFDSNQMELIFGELLELLTRPERLILEALHEMPTHTATADQLAQKVGLTRRQVLSFMGVTGRRLNRLLPKPLDRVVHLMFEERIHAPEGQSENLEKTYTIRPELLVVIGARAT